MNELVSKIVPLGTLISHFVLIFLLISFIFRKNWGRTVVLWVGRRALILSLFIVLAAFLGSLYYSNVLGFEPCILCWWQRVLIFPQVILFLTALKNKDRKVFDYSIRLSILALIIGIYQSYVNLGGGSILPCTATGSACAKVYVLEYGYITIPLMSATIAAYLVLIFFINKFYVKNNSNA